MDEQNQKSQEKSSTAESTEKMETESGNVIGNNTSMKDFTAKGFGLLMQSSKFSNSFPSGPTRTMYSAYPTFNRVVRNQSNEILDVISSVMQMQKIKGNIQRRDNDEKFELLLECNDAILERVNTNLDDLAGLRKQSETILVPPPPENNSSTPHLTKLSGSWNEKNKTHTPSKIKPAKLLMVKNIARPQEMFKEKIDNNPGNPFQPKIKYKPNSIKPLAILAEYNDSGEIESYLHPYEFELGRFEVPKSQLIPVEAEKPKSLDETPLIFVKNEVELKNLLDCLYVEKCLAIDLEHHSYRSFQGITCLMQISTRTQDFIIDTLALREELHILNEVFTDPKIVKIFHGADLDVEWLQRDLGLYIVNMFDTHQAAKRLGFARLSLQFLMKYYCHIDADKTFQLADWRIRPLPKEFINYARQDTHYLPYIYDLLTNELLKKANGQVNLLQSVYQSSTEICKKRYVKPRIFADSYTDFYHKSKRVFDNRQLYALNAIYEWRDKTARSEDESYGYVLPNHMLLQIAETLPREIQGILACCNPIPPLVRQNLPILHKFILKARDQPLVKPIPDELNINRSAAVNKNKDLTGLLFCPHDLMFNAEFRDDLPTLLGYSSLKHFKNLTRAATKSALSIFHEIAADEEMTTKKLNQIKFISPYSRYLAMLPFAEKQRLEELAKQEEENKKKRLCPEINQEEFIVKTEPNMDIDSDNDRIASKRIRNDQAKPSANEPVSKKQRNTESATIDNVNEKILEDSNPESETEANTSDTTFNDNPKQFFKSKKDKKRAKRMIEKALKNKQKSMSSGNSNNQERKEFNYEQVDFSKIQGGSHQQQKPNQDSKYKQKGKRIRNDKKFNKMLTFGKGNTNRKQK